MILFLGICVWVLLALCVVLSGRVKRLQEELAWWREEAIRLNNKLPQRDDKGRYCKRPVSK